MRLIQCLRHFILFDSRSFLLFKLKYIQCSVRQCAPASSLRVGDDIAKSAENRMCECVSVWESERVPVCPLGSTTVKPSETF